MRATTPAVRSVLPLLVLSFSAFAGGAADYYMEKGDAAWQAGNFNDALGYYGTVVKLDARNAVAYEKLGKTYQKLGNAAEAAKSFEAQKKLQAEQLKQQAEEKAAARPAVAAGGKPGGIPVGTYNCRGIDYRTGSAYVVVGRIVIEDAQRYVYVTTDDKEKIPGTYSFNARSGAITWNTGRLKGWKGAYEKSATIDRMKISAQRPDAPNALLDPCYLAE